MKTVEKQGKTVDEAIQKALEELQVSRDEVEVEILDEGNRGILGFLSKQAKVKVIVKPKPDQIARDFLKGLLKFFDCNAEIKNSLEGNVLNLEIIGENTGILIGKRGNTLDAIQYLTSLVVNRNSKDFIRVLLDAENYREKREKTLQRLALKMADRVKETKRSITLEPMYPNERRIIHTALQTDPRVTTKSIGKEPNRRVVISLK
ncbi:MAG TPA: protein jag [Thermoanaerobacterales bacterium]|uniref:RNA-binding cell elongation regulator Jag/EloR n=1 Tax=Tepidanaerobacter sp. GT38 TaxID=2722793 RepID=UPI0017917254|nr:RNA-binding cell elongation regulator Jag/EloR [Tepidanaerobacter sp. GT38]MCG1011712.1 protein jag [Tepidanaerobacter sp. GT38]HHY41700.1 protein jag [Thermoanaerobacterales bacterium]